MREPNDSADVGQVRDAVRRALEEDRAMEDVTTLSVVPAGERSGAILLFRAPALLAGTSPFAETFRLLDETMEIRWRHSEGEPVAGGEVCRLCGSLSAILRGERVALNFLMRLSGVATITARFVEAVRGTGVEILDTRKTTPGLRFLEKAAVRAGGGVNHRPHLAAMALLKENHIARAGGPAAAVARIRHSHPGIAIEVEVRSLEELEDVLPLGVERVMLDNFSLDAIRSAVDRIGREEKPPYVEVSGGVTLETVRTIAELGVSGISVGALTHSAPSADVSLLVDRE